MFIKIISLPIHIYRLFISPLTGKNCRFEPTCSEYALEALKTHGIFYGIYLSIKSGYSNAIHLADILVMILYRLKNNQKILLDKSIELSH